MQVSEYLRELYDYHYWANECTLRAVKDMPDEKLHRERAHSWGSIYATLLHMLNAEWIWLQRWKGNSPSAFPVRKDYPTLAAMIRRWVELEEEMRFFVASQTEESLVQTVEYTNTRGERYRLPRWQMMAHVPNHACHHRGELAAMLALMGVPHQEEDMLHFLLEKNGQR